MKLTKVNYIPEPVCNYPILWNILDQFREKVVLAGGCFRSALDGTRLNDFDFFLHKDQDVLAVVDYVQGLLEARVKLGQDRLETKFSHFFGVHNSLPIQIIKSFRFENPESVIQRFDFHNSKKAVWRAKDHYYVINESNLFESDCKKKVLTYSGNGSGPMALLRALKFVNLGYKLSPQNLATILAECEEQRLQKHVDYLNSTDNDISKTKVEEYQEMIFKCNYYEEI